MGLAWTPLEIHPYYWTPQMPYNPYAAGDIMGWLDTILCCPRNPQSPMVMGIWQVVASDSLKFHLGLPCPTFLRSVGHP
jgi:hypothetical protein